MYQIPNQKFTHSPVSTAVFMEVLELSYIFIFLQLTSQQSTNKIQVTFSKEIYVIYFHLLCSTAQTQKDTSKSPVAVA